MMSPTRLSRRGLWPVAALFVGALIVIALLGAGLFGLVLSGAKSSGRDVLRSPGGFDGNRSRHPAVLPAAAAAQLGRSLEAARGVRAHLWRDTPPVNADGSVNAYVEIARGDRNKWEFDMQANARALDRVIPAALGGYPVNYGFVPQTVSYDGDPFDVLVLGPPLPGGQIVTGVAVGVLLMDDEKGLDSKIIISPIDRQGRPQHGLTAARQREIGDYFARYKTGQPGKFSTVSGWGSRSDGLALIATTHAFFRKCRQAAPGTTCAVEP